jgi:hypothetical protein
VGDAGVKVFISGRQCELGRRPTVGHVSQQYCPEADVVIINSMPVSDMSTAVCEGDHGCSIVASCLDGAAEKAAIMSGLLEYMPQSNIVAASGLAGIGDGAAIRSRKIFS